MISLTVAFVPFSVVNSLHWVAFDIRRERRWVELKNQEALADVQTYDSASESRRSSG